MLSAHEINDIVDRLRAWLVESNEQLENHEFDELTELTREGAAPGVGLLEVAEAFTALRQEIKLHTKGVRALHERVEKGLDNLGDATAQLQAATAGVEQHGDAESRQLINTLLDIDEAVDQALATCRSDAEGTSDRDGRPEVDQGWAELCEREFQQLPKWRRALLRSWHDRMVGLIQQLIRQERLHSSAPDQADYASGLQMLKTKLQRTLAGMQVAPIDGIGKPVDPNQMRIVATVVDADRQPGTVVEQVRPGYLRNGQVLRHAEVKVVGP